MNTAELNALAHDIAYHAARSDIECNVHEQLLDSRTWYNLRRIDSIWVEEVRKSIRYLDARGLLERHPIRSHLVRVLDAKEAKR